MDTLPAPLTMTDKALLAAWYWVSADAENREDRTTALATEMNKRDIRF